MNQTDSLVAAIEGNYAGMKHSDLVLTCEMLARGREGWRKEAEQAQAQYNQLLNKVSRPTCLFARDGRGDCEHFIGLPGLTIEGQHDGPPHEDVYGKPNGWCWACWWGYKMDRLNSLNAELVEALKRIGNNACGRMWNSQEEATIEACRGILKEATAALAKAQEGKV